MREGRRPDWRDAMLALRPRSQRRFAVMAVTKKESDVGSITLPANPVYGAHVAPQRCTILRYG